MAGAEPTPFEEILQGVFFIVAVFGRCRYGVADFRDLRFPDRQRGEKARHLVQGEFHVALSDDRLLFLWGDFRFCEPLAGGARKGAGKAPEYDQSLHV